MVLCKLGLGRYLPTGSEGVWPHQRRSRPLLISGNQPALLRTLLSPPHRPIPIQTLQGRPQAYPLSSCPPASPFRRFASAAGQFVLLAGLRAQVAPSLTSPSAPGQPKSGQMAASSVGEEFPQVTQERYAAISHRIVEDTTGRTRDADVDGALVLLVWAERLRTFVSRV
jgi:hypothetical protein